jgi:hypothetical protein
MKIIILLSIKRIYSQIKEVADEHYQIEIVEMHVEFNWKLQPTTTEINSKFKGVVRASLYENCGKQ